VEKGLRCDYIMPTMDEVDVFAREAAAVAMKAIEQGIAGITNITYAQEYENASAMIMRARGLVQDAMAIGYIPMPEGSHAPRPTQKASLAVAQAASSNDVPPDPNASKGCF